MTAMVSKYRALLPTRSMPAGPPSLAVVVLTGATGSLGAQLLAQLLADASVKKIYNLLRAKDDADAVARVTTSMEERGLVGVEDERVVCLASDLAKGQLGLSSSRYEEIVSSATIILHNAW